MQEMDTKRKVIRETLPLQVHTHREIDPLDIDTQKKGLRDTETDTLVTLQVHTHTEIDPLSIHREKGYKRET